MDSLSLVAIAIVVLAVVIAVIALLRRRQDSSFGRMPLSLDDPPVNPVAPRHLDEPAVSPAVPRHSVALSGADLAAISALVAGDNKIEAIKRVRELTGMGLKESKDYVEALPRVSLANLPTPAAAPVASPNLAALDLSEVSALLAGGNKIAAIKRLRELTGLGLKEAKDYVEAMPSGAPLPALPRPGAVQPAATGSMADVHSLAQQGRKIEAIKLYRQLTGVGLKEAKDYVDRLYR